MRKMQWRQTGIRQDGGPTWRPLDSGIDAAVLMRGRMIIAEGNQRTDFQHAIRSGATQFVLDHRRVLALQHEYAFFNFDVVNFIDNNWKWIEAKFFQEPMSLRMHDSRIAVYGEIVALTIENESFLELREQQHASDRRFRGGSQKSVVAAR